jgi:guanylate kinase
MPHDDAGQQGLLVIVSGPSGAGKTTIARAIHGAFPGSTLSLSLTTRPIGPTEKEGVDYHFASEEEFQRGVDEGAFLEHAGVYGKRYGTPRKPVEEGLAAGRLVILEIDVQGAKQVKGKIPGALAMFVLAPTEEELLERLRARKRDSEEVIQKRFARAREEMTEARRCGVYERFIVNDELERAKREAIDAVRARMRG